MQCAKACLKCSLQCAMACMNAPCKTHCPDVPATSSSLCCCIHRSAVADPHHISAPQLCGLFVQVWRQVFEQVIVSMLIFQLLMVGLCSLKSAPIQVSIVRSTHRTPLARDARGQHSCICQYRRAQWPVRHHCCPSCLTTFQCCSVIVLQPHHPVSVCRVGWTAGASALPDGAVSAGSYWHL